MGRPPTAETCLGWIISHGALVQDGAGTKSANFGLTKSGDWVLGQLSAPEVKDMDFEELVGARGIERLTFSGQVSGFGWLVINGTVQPAAGGEVRCRVRFRFV